MSGPVCLTETATSKPSKAPHHRPVRRQMRPAAARRIFVGSEACSSRAALDLCSLLLVENSSPYTKAVERYSAERCMQGTPTPPSLYRGRGTRAGEASLEFLSFDGVGGGVQACNQTHCLHNQLPVRRIQAALSCRQPDSVLFGNTTCCTIETLST